MVSRFISRKGAFPQLGIKAPVVTVSVDNVTRSGLQTIDSITLQENDRVMLVNQDIPAENGIYNAATVSWERSPDWNEDGDVTSGVMIINTSRMAMYIASFAGSFIIDSTVVQFNTIYGEVGIAASNLQIYNPGYLPTYISSTSFKLEGGIDLTDFYYVNRRLRLEGSDGQVYYGAIATSVYGTDTTITMTMEGADIVPIDLITAVMVSSDQQWTPIPINNHTFRSMPKARLVSGRIGYTNWWVIVGENGFIATSNDLGQSWTERTITGGLTTEKINDVAYDHDSESFMAVADDTWIITSDDGVTWVSSQPSDLTGAITTGDGHLRFIAYGYTRQQIEPGFMLLAQLDNTFSSEIYSTTNNGVNWTNRVVGAQTQGLNYWNYNSQPTILTSQVWWYHHGHSHYSVFPTANTQMSNSNHGSVGAQPFDITWMKSLEEALIVYEGGQVQSALNWGQSTYTERVIGGSGIFGSTDLLCCAYSDLQGRIVMGGKEGKMGYTDDNRNFTSIANGFNPTAHILDIWFDEYDAIWIGISNDGNICRSTTGIS